MWTLVTRTGNMTKHGAGHQITRHATMGCFRLRSSANDNRKSRDQSVESREHFDGIVSREKHRQVVATIPKKTSGDDADAGSDCSTCRNFKHAFPTLNAELRYRIDQKVVGADNYKNCDYRGEQSSPAHCHQQERSANQRIHNADRWPVNQIPQYRHPCDERGA